MTLERSDFRVRKTPHGYRITQRIGNGWETLTDTHPTRADAIKQIQEYLR